MGTRHRRGGRFQKETTAQAKACGGRERSEVKRMRSGGALPGRRSEAGLRVRFLNDPVQPWALGQ